MGGLVGGSAPQTGSWMMTHRYNLSLLKFKLPGYRSPQGWRTSPWPCCACWQSAPQLGACSHPTHLKITMTQPTIKQSCIPYPDRSSAPGRRHTQQSWWGPQCRPPPTPGPPHTPHRCTWPDSSKTVATILLLTLSGPRRLLRSGRCDWLRPQSSGSPQQTRKRKEEGGALGKWRITSMPT